MFPALVLLLRNLSDKHCIILWLQDLDKKNREAEKLKKISGVKTIMEAFTGVCAEVRWYNTEKQHTLFLPGHMSAGHLDTEVKQAI